MSNIVIDLCPTERDRAAAIANGRLPAVRGPVNGPYRTPVYRAASIEDRSASEFMAVVAEHAEAHDCSRTEAMRNLVADFPEGHGRWVQNLRKQAETAGRNRK